MDKRIDELIRLYKARELTAATLTAAAEGPLNSRGGTYLTSSFARRDDLPITASLRRMSDAVARGLAERGSHEPVSLKTLPGCWWLVNVDAVEIGDVGEYGCAYVKRVLSSEQLANMGFEVVGGPFADWENVDVAEAILKQNSGKFWDARISNRSLLATPEPNNPTSAYDDAYTSETLLAALKDGKVITVFSGPFNTADDAHYALDLRWESPE